MSLREDVAELWPLQSLAHFATIFPDFFPRICAEFYAHVNEEMTSPVQSTCMSSLWFSHQLQDAARDYMDDQPSLKSTLLIHLSTPSF